MYNNDVNTYNNFNHSGCGMMILKTRPDYFNNPLHDYYTCGEMIAYTCTQCSFQVKTHCHIKVSLDKEA